MRGSLVLSDSAHYLVSSATRRQHFSLLAQLRYILGKSFFERLSLFETATLNDHALLHSVLHFVRRGWERDLRSHTSGRAVLNKVCAGNGMGDTTKVNMQRAYFRSLG